MVTTLRAPGIDNHDSAAAALVQKTEVEETMEVDKVLGTVSGVTQVAKAYAHTKVNKFTVTGKGNLTLATGTGGDPELTLISGGVVFISSMKYTQDVSKSSEWTYAGEHYPSAA
jgi:hypothetical protein